MFKNVIIFCLLVAINMPLLNKLSIVYNYYSNRSFITENFCENKAKPALNCNGQCFLMKKLKAADDQETKRNAERIEKIPEFILFIEPIHTFSNKVLKTFAISKGQILYNRSLYLCQTFFGIFHPPQLLKA